MTIQKIGYFAVGAAATVLLQRVLETSRARRLRAAASDGRVVVIDDWKRQKARRTPGSS